MLGLFFLQSSNQPSFIINQFTGEITGYKTEIGGADTVFPFKSVIYLGTGTSFDLSSYDSYESFTIDNFIVEPQNCSDGVSGSSTIVVNNLYTKGILTKTYNSSTGILTSYYKCYATHSIYTQTAQAKVKAYLV